MAGLNRPRLPRPVEVPQGFEHTTALANVLLVELATAVPYWKAASDAFCAGCSEHMSRYVRRRAPGCGIVLIARYIPAAQAALSCAWSSGFPSPFASICTALPRQILERCRVAGGKAVEEQPIECPARLREHFVGLLS